MHKDFLTNCEKAEKVYRAINHTLRQQILQAITTTPKSVTELYVQFRLEQSIMSMQLRILREAKLVKVTPNGKHKLYSFNAEAVTAIESANMSLGSL